METIKNLMSLYRRVRYQQKGLAMLEYAAGALVIASAVWLAMTGFGNSLELFFNNLGAWLVNQSANLPQ